jgi:hypothetical protein
MDVDALLLKGRVHTLNGHSLSSCSCLVTVDHTADIEDKTEQDDTKHDNQKSATVIVCDMLELSGHPTDTGLVGEATAIVYLTFVAFPVLGVILVGHLFPDEHFLDTHILDGFKTKILLVFTLPALFQILIEQGSPVDYQQSVGVVLRPRHTFQLTCGNKLPPKDG